MKKREKSDKETTGSRKLSMLDIAKKLEKRELFIEKKAKGIKVLKSLNTAAN